jgi:N-acetyl-anhydromuramyl-L-alanine amidase AmpD
MKVEESYTNIGGGNQSPHTIVIHAMAENIRLDSEYKGIEVGTYQAHDWLQKDGTSAHFLLKPDGSFIKQRSTKKICWHARGFNTGSIGIEVLVKGTYNYPEFIEKIKTDWVTNEQYSNLIEMCKGIVDFYNIEKIVRHSDLSPNRKHDPGSGFKWDWFKNEVYI